ncbi:uncharacterized protein LOC118746258 [Rhagoletis pomonella]|uniref:uncharacterized protein LOC118746258 n=1 Tax=Rhagoletis pomonella TaxID=28610 RepID=UPI00177E0592|nr:uncharacterized protein LOC118746258 [Rhagoletis pomonella]XP_036335997.1 uncharacterized protein LOC118746258 [Rhagoletis pomonella]
MGIKRDEAERLAHDVRECNKIFGKVKHDRTQEIKGLVKVEEGTGPNQVDVNGIFQFERQRDILRRILAQGVPLDEAIPLAREAGESQEPFDRALAKRFVREQLSDIRSSSDEITVTGGARKRFRILVSKGVHIEKARIVCQCPVKTRQLRFALSGTIIEPTPKAPKRPVRAANTKSSPANFRSSGTGNTSNSNIAYEQSQNALRDNKSHPQQININETQCKNTRHIEPQISTSIRYRQETPFLGTMIEPHTNDDPLRIKLAVISPDFPLTIWPTEMLKGIQHFISKAADNEGIDLTSLYASCSFRPGWIAYSITDMRTAQWFRTRVPHLRPYEAFLAVVDQDAVPRSQIFVGYIPEQRNLSNDDLLEAIGMKKQRSPHTGLERN